MDIRKAICGACGFILIGSSGMAQTVGTEVQRDINQQNRIEQGLQSGQLSTGEAGRLEKAVPRLQWSDVGAASDHHGGEGIVLFCGEETHVTDM